MLNIRTRCLSWLATTILFLPLMASAQIADINVQAIDGRLATGAGTFDGGPWATPARSFGAVLEPEFYATDPGWNALGAGSPALLPGLSSLAPNTDLSWDYLPAKIDGTARNIFYWDGQGAVAFGPPPGEFPYQVALQGRNGTFFSTERPAQLVPGGVIERTDAFGSMHRHRVWAVDDLDGSLATDPASGVYLATVRLRMTGFDRSEPVHVLFATSDVAVAALTSAVDWVAAHAEGLAPDFAADANGDLVVDQLDLGVWRTGFGSTGTLALQASGDATFDDVVDGVDFLTWQRQFGSSVDSLPGAQALGASVAQVPEPAGAILLAEFLGATTCYARRRRRRTIKPLPAANTELAANA